MLSPIYDGNYGVILMISVVLGKELVQQGLSPLSLVLYHIRIISKPVGPDTSNYMISQVSRVPIMYLLKFDENDF